jgi:hypothetical protein
MPAECTNRSAPDIFVKLLHLVFDPFVFAALSNPTYGAGKNVAIKL